MGDVLVFVGLALLVAFAVLGVISISVGVVFDRAGATALASYALALVVLSGGLALVGLTFAAAG